MLKGWIDIPRLDSIDSVIPFAVIMHMLEGVTLISGDRGADWTYPFQVYLAIAEAAGGSRLSAGIGVVTIALLGLAASLLPRMPFWARTVFLLLQISLLSVVSLWVLDAIAHSMSALGQATPPIGLAINQFLRITAPLVYFLAVKSRLRAEP